MLAEFPEDAGAPPLLLQASAAQADAANRHTDPAAESTALRGYYERWVDEHDGRTMVGLSGVPQRRFRGLVRYLQAFAAGENPPDDLAPEGMASPRFVRLAADDMKAFFLEARMSQRPDERDNDLQRWLWSETAMGSLLASVAERLVAQGDERTAQGIAR